MSLQKKDKFTHTQILNKIRNLCYLDNIDDIRYNETPCKLDNIIVHTKKKFIYFKISKTAGNSLHRETLDKIYGNNPKNVYFDARSSYFIKWLNNVTDLDTYYLFSVIRNTYERVISLYTHNLIQRKSISDITFDNFLEIYSTSNSLNNYPQIKTVTIDNKIFLDYIGNIDNLTDVWNTLINKNILPKPPPSKKYEIPYTIKLSKEKLYTDKNKKKIFEINKEEINFFNFKFDIANQDDRLRDGGQGGGADQQGDRAERPPPPPNLKLLHVGKTGGQFLQNYIRKYNIQFINVLNHDNSRIRNGNYILVVRCPIKRAISGFFSRYRWIITPNNDLTKKELNLFKYWENNYKSLSDLFEDIYSVNTEKRQQAQLIMNTITHLWMDFNFYLESIEHLKQNINKIKFVLTTENLNNDFSDLLKDYNHKFIVDKAIYKNDTNQFKNKDLSNKAIINLLKWYRKDYEIIEYLHTSNKISNEYFNYINRYNYLQDN